MAKNGVSQEYIGPPILEKIQMYILTRAEILYTLCYEIPCSRLLHVWGGKKLVRECNKSPQAAAKRKEESSEIISLTVPSTYIILIHVPKFFFLSKTCEPPRHYITECGSACCCHQNSASEAAWPPPPSTPRPPHR